MILYNNDCRLGGSCCFAFASIGPATRLKISVEPPATTHELSVAKSQAWLDTNGKTPREQATKVTLRQLLGRG